MANKIWNMTEIATEEQNIRIYPTEMYDGIIVEVREAGNELVGSRLYLSQDEMDLFIHKMKDMMAYVKQ